jgi:glyoxylase-like metal-dependent hydrolase (beta-lactamase superfamily II)
MLIDCGSLGASTTGVKMADVVADIRDTTQDHLHLLIATHEHQDHVSGFRNCKKEFDKMTVDRVLDGVDREPEGRRREEDRKR